HRLAAPVRRRGGRPAVATRGHVLGLLAHSSGHARGGPLADGARRGCLGLAGTGTTGTGLALSSPCLALTVSRDLQPHHPAAHGCHRLRDARRVIPPPASWYTDRSTGCVHAAGPLPGADDTDCGGAILCGYQWRPWVGGHRLADRPARARLLGGARPVAGAGDRAVLAHERRAHRADRGGDGGMGTRHDDGLCPSRARLHTVRIEFRPVALARAALPP